MDLPVFIDDPETFISEAYNSSYRKYFQNKTSELITLFNSKGLIDKLAPEDIIKFIGGRINELPRKI